MSPKTYQIIRKIHLYACLTTCAVLLMFILSSYTMIHHDRFDHSSKEIKKTVMVKSSALDPSDWNRLLREHNIKGRLTNERINGQQVTRNYSSAGSNSKLTHSIDQGQVEITTSKKSKAGTFFGIHRQRGYGGGVQYNMYAFLLDITGVSIILFTITGVLLWFHLLKNSRIAWVIFIVGAIYYAVVMAYLMV